MVESPLTIAPPTAVPTSGFDLTTLTAGRIVEARVTALAGQAAMLASRHGALEVDLGGLHAAVGDVLRFEVRSITGGDGQARLELALAPPGEESASAAAKAATPVDPVQQALGRAVARAVTTQSGLAPLYATLAGLASSPSAAVPDTIRALVGQLMGARLAASGPPTAATVTTAFRNSGLFSEARAAVPDGEAAGGDLKSTLTALRGELTRWVGASPGGATTAAARAAANAPPSSGGGASGSAAVPKSGAIGGERAGPATAEGLAIRAAYGTPSGGARAPSGASDLGGGTARLAAAVYGFGAARPAPPSGPTGVSSTTGPGGASGAPGAAGAPASPGVGGSAGTDGDPRPLGAPLDPSRPGPGGIASDASSAGTTLARLSAQTTAGAAQAAPGNPGGTPPGSAMVVPPSGDGPAVPATAPGTTVAAPVLSSAAPGQTPQSAPTVPTTAPPTTAAVPSAPSAALPATSSIAPAALVGTAAAAPLPGAVPGPPTAPSPLGGTAPSALGVAPDTGFAAPSPPFPSTTAPPTVPPPGRGDAPPLGVGPAPLSAANPPSVSATPGAVAAAVPVPDAGAATPTVSTAPAGGTAPPTTPIEPTAPTGPAIPATVRGPGAAEGGTPLPSGLGRGLLVDVGTATEAAEGLAAAAQAGSVATARDRGLKPPPPRRGLPPVAQAAMTSEAGATDDATALGRRALERTEGALQRILLEQYVALDTHGDDVLGVAARGQREWTAELPLATPTGTSIVQMTVERDGGNTSGDVEAPAIGWRLRFALDVEPIGPIHAQIGLSGEHLSVGLWIERAEMAERLATDVGQLTAALADGGLTVEPVRVRTGTPPTTRDETGSPSGHFIDVSL